MTNWQFITIIGTLVLSFFGLILTILGTARVTQASIQASITEQFTAFRNEVKAEIEALRAEMRQNDKRYEERFNRIEADIRRIEADIREIKHDLRQVFKPVLPA